MTKYSKEEQARTFRGFAPILTPQKGLDLGFYLPGSLDPMGADAHPGPREGVEAAVGVSLVHRKREFRAVPSMYARN